MIKGMVLYKKSSGTKLLYSSTKDNVIYGVVQDVSGKTYPEKSVQAIISKGYWDAVYLTNDDVEKHQQHDQSSHGNWASGGGTIGDYARAYKRFTLTEDEEDTLSDYGSSAYKDINNFARLGLKSSNPEYQNYLSQAVTNMDNAIERAPLVENSNALWRVFSPKAFLNLEIGKTYEDKGFMSTSLNDLSDKKNSEVKDNFMNVGGISQILGKILPNGNYKGISMNNTKVFNDFDEREFILPRNTQLTFLGFEQQNTTDDFERPIVENIAVFQRVN